jgi:membrane fusion protein (multidrug efflux system)
MSGCREGEAQAQGAEATSEKGEGKEVGKKKGAAKAHTDEVSAKTANVKVVKLEPSSLTEFIVANGTTRAIRDVTYSAEVAGKIEALPIKLGDRIRRGRLLARIDFQTLKAQAEQAQTSYDLAESTYERFASLKDENVISQQRIDEARSNMLSAKSAVAIADANVKKAVVRASYPGIVGAKLVEKGEFVAPGTPLLVVVDYKTIVVEARLPETQVARVNREKEVEVMIEALGKSFQGKVDTLIPTADSASKTFTLRVKVDNPDYAILVGMSAKVKIAAIEHEEVLIVPQSAVIEALGKRRVFVEDKGQARMRDVRLGPVQGNRVVVAEGVEAGESLIVVGQRDLEDGQKVRVIP